MSFAAQRLGWGASAAFSPIKRTYAGVATTTETIPSGAAQVVIEGWGGGGSGGRGYGQNGVGAGGGGGGAGGYFKKTIAGLTSADWNKTMTMAGQDLYPSMATVSSGTYSLTTLTANIGHSGTAATSASAFGIGATGGTASNGDTNTTGGSGTNGSAAPLGGTGATGTTGTNGGPYGHGGNGQDYANDHDVDSGNTPAPGLNVNRSAGAYVFYYT